MTCNEHHCLVYANQLNKVSNIDIRPKDNFSLGEGLESFYPLLEKVFNYLGLDDLKNVSKVNRVWKGFAENVLTKRKKLKGKLGWVSISYKGKNDYTISSNPYLGYSYLKFGIIFYDGCLKTYHRFCYHKSDKITEQINCKFMRNVFVRRFTGKILVVDLFHNYVIPKSTDYCFVPFTFIHSIYLNLDPASMGSRLFDGCFFPQISNIRIVGFNIGEKLTIFKGEKIKCILFFSVDAQKNDFFKAAVVPRYKTDIAIGGAVLDDQIIYSHNNYCGLNTDSFCIAFMEKINKQSTFGAYSIVIGHEENFDEAVTKFKNNIVLRENSVSFRFCSSSRNKILADSEIFQISFPDTIQLALLSWEIVGENNIMVNNDLIDKSASRKRILDIADFTHYSSDVLILLTWGKKL